MTIFVRLQSILTNPCFLFKFWVHIHSTSQKKTQFKQIKKFVSGFLPSEKKRKVGLKYGKLFCQQFSAGRTFLMAVWLVMKQRQARFCKFHLFLATAVLLLQQTQVILSEIKIYQPPPFKNNAGGGISEHKIACLFICIPYLPSIKWGLYGTSILLVITGIREEGKALIQSNHKRGKQAKASYSASFSTKHEVTSHTHTQKKSETYGAKLI